MNRSLVLGATLVTLSGLMSGCFGGQGTLEAPGPPISLPAFCVVLEASCHEHPNGDLVIEGLEIVQNPDGVETAIQIVGTNQNVTIRNATISGFSTAIRVETTLCAGCTLHVDGARLVGIRGGEGTATSSGFRGGIVGFRPPAGHLPQLVITNSTIEGFDNGVVWQDDPYGGAGSALLARTSVACRTSGAWITAGTIVLNDVTATGCMGTGITLGGFTSATINGAAVNDNWQGLALQQSVAGSSALITSSTFIGNHIGGLFARDGTVTVTTSRFEANGAAPSPHSYGRPWTDVVHAFFLANGNATLANNCITGNPGWGAATTLFGSIEAAGNWWGSAAGPRQGTLPQGDYAPPQTAPGEGDVVSAGVSFVPFETAAPAACQV